MTIDLLSRKRRYPLSHPWNWGYSNNRQLAAAVGQGYADKTAYARACGYTGRRKVLVRDGKVLSHGGVSWHEFVERLENNQMKGVTQCNCNV